MKSAMQGHPRAQYNVALMYAHGTGVGVDYQKAAEWLEKAGKQGHREAQTALGDLYLGG
jgi:hypothetical protein